MKKVLVTGASGFVGSCLTRRLVSEGHDIHILVRASTDPWRLSDIRKNISEHSVDLRDSERLDKVVADIRPAVTYHCATYGGFSDQRDTRSILESNIIGTANLLKACERTGFEYFVNTGSSSEYGIKSKPMREEDVPEPREDYGVSKAAATMFCRAESLAKQLPVVTLRLFSPFGPWDDPRRLIPYVIKSCLTGGTPGLSSPDSVRDFIFIDDVIDAYVSVIRQPFRGEVINIGTGRQHSIGEVAAVIRSLVADCPEPTWGAVEKRRPEPSVWTANIDRANALFSWKPSIPFTEGLERTVAWMKNNLHLYP